MHQDFKELLSAFNAGQARYLIVDGYAVSFHAQPRATKDLDILIGADAENSKAVYAALAKFGAPVEGLVKVAAPTYPGDFSGSPRSRCREGSGSKTQGFIRKSGQRAGRRSELVAVKPKSLR
jgi:hypothetical protein